MSADHADLEKPPLTHKKTSYRAMTSLVTTWSFVIATVTGVVLFIVPQGRIAYWMNWKLWALSKDGWIDLHVIFSIVFVVVGVAHLVYNWKPFKNYMASKAAGHVHVTRTVYGSLAITAVFFALSIFNLPPASWISDLGASFKDGWVISADYEPPFGHAEEVSLAGFAQRQRIDLKTAEAELKAAGYKIPDVQMKLKDLAALNDVTAMNLYLVIRPLEQRLKLKATMNPVDVEAQFSGSGIGRKTVAQMAAELNMDVSTAQARLKAAGIDAAANDKLKTLAEAHKVQPMDLVKMMQIEGYKP